VAYYAQWHRDNYERLKVSRDARRRRNAALILAAKRGGCSRCPENDPRCLDFHHREPALKAFVLGSKEAKDCTVERLQAEIAKCDLLCANCHRKEHLAPVAEMC
jgi:hypothetical protein